MKPIEEVVYERDSSHPLKESLKRMGVNVIEVDNDGVTFLVELYLRLADSEKDKQKRDEYMTASVELQKIRDEECVMYWLRNNAIEGQDNTIYVVRGDAHFSLYPMFGVVPIIKSRLKIEGISFVNFGPDTSAIPSQEVNYHARLFEERKKELNDAVKKFRDE